jgi:sulfide:quinone oxidoreductase
VSRSASSRARVVVAGGGVAGLETLLVLRVLAGERVEVTLVAPEPAFLNRSMAVDQPFKPQRVRGLSLERVTAEVEAHWHRGVLDRVEADGRCVVTREGVEVPYDFLVLAVGARFDREWSSDGVLTYHDGDDAAAYRLLLDQLDHGRAGSIAFVKPGGASWPLPLYDLALLTATRCMTRHRSGVQLSLITPEPKPLGIFGDTVSAAVRGLLEDSGVALYPGSYGVPGHRGWVEIAPGDRGIRVDRVVSVPRLVGPRLRGIACEHDGFIRTDVHGRVSGLDGVFAAGDATTFPIKQGGLAAQQADAVAETIAALVGADVDPQPFRPVLRGVLLTGAAPRYLRHELAGAGEHDSVISEQPLWWPPDKISGRYLAPYLSRQVGDAADVMPEGKHAPSIETTLGAFASDKPPVWSQLTDLPPVPANGPSRRRRQKMSLGGHAPATAAEGRGSVSRRVH